MTITTMPAHSFRIEWPQADYGYTVCRPVGELEAYSVSLFREALDEVVAGTRLVIDLSKVTFLDSAGLGALIGAVRRVRESAGQVALTCPRPAISRLLETTGFDRIVAICPTVEDALAALDARRFA
jgi:anti-sigma B factor antagonist